ncbi:hypothetical protein FRB94_012177 [Tulasnella sp. JGI-2019a]|nr:hypothetical protein FRB94_012177 [Tulasnella sp. JGI-2019a]KAG9012730.1 hypothetical protein FRB93_001283 [Tulasnella sp. JGI-2019a]KAG9035216.1 hypothetical protein FRB95_011659 [Tulasnella sp. JGI-2019a]
MSSNASTVLPQGAGYGVVIGIGLFFSGIMLGLTFIQKRYTAFSPSNAEEFTSASRSVKPGLIAAGIVSAWTWAATLLQSSAVAYRYGISGPYWYAAGATVQVLLFAQLAAKLKLNAPNAHTFLEIIDVRFGRVGHAVFLFFALSTNFLVSSMLTLGGSATVTDLTGMNTIAACFLIPIGVSVYVVVGGMRATLLCDYTHTTVLFIIIMLFTFTVYGTSNKIGSPRAMHALLTKLVETAPVADNAGGSYLTMRSTGGIIFGVINLVGNFATVFLDQAYWQRGIASSPSTSVKAFLLGGLAWFPIPFLLATTLGLAARALTGDPAMRILSDADIGAGLPAPAAAAALLGKGGAAAMLVLLFLAVTSATSAELIAVSSILTYDVYKRYINPQATERQILFCSHLMIVSFALFMGVAGTVFFYIGISMGWLYLFMGTVLGSAVVPVALAITWRKTNPTGCIAGALGGFAAGLIAWLVATSVLNHGVLNATTTGGNYPMLAGNVASIAVGGVIAVGWTLLRPDNEFTWEQTRAINSPDSHVTQNVVKESTSREDDEKRSIDDKKSDRGVQELVQPVNAEDPELKGFTTEQDLDRVGLKKAFRFAVWASVILFIILIILVPLPLFGSSVVYGTAGFTAWTAIGIIWMFCGFFTVVIYPVYESRQAIAMVFKGIMKDVFSKGSGAYVEPTAAT